jgi:hypothetical protein
VDFSIFLRQIAEFQPCAIRLLAPAVDKAEFLVIVGHRVLADFELKARITKKEDLEISPFLNHQLRQLTGGNDNASFT